MSTLSRSLNSLVETPSSSPPMTRCSNCLGFGVSGMLFDPRAQYTSSRKREASIPNKIYERRMPVPAGCDEHPVPRHGTIIDHSSARKGRQRTARFVHQKISRCKVPVMAVAAGYGGVDLALRDPGKPQRQRPDP